MIVFALVIHVVFFASVFDIYFKSPVVKSSTQFAPEDVAPAKRLVLFVADGLRADSLYSLNDSEVPYIRKIIRQFGTSGVSHTSVPTESRPGHVALIAGMLEDPSAIAKGWKENPVDFDTVFNQSRFTWCWGSPDILPMFSKGASLDTSEQPRVFIQTYEPSFEDFSSNDLSQLDTWVFDRVDNFFASAAEDVDLRLKLREDKLVFFLHLLGCDTNGHANKPGSKELLHNIRLLDTRIQAAVQTIEKYFRSDSRTAYIFTSDHGMTDWGSHGAGMHHETQTPLLAWGAGIKRPVEQQFTSSAGWPLIRGVWQASVNQTDVAVLMSALLGISMPMNSIGKLPEGFLNVHPSYMVQAKMANALQLFEQFASLQRQFLQGFFHQPFDLIDRPTFDKLHAKAVLQESRARYADALATIDLIMERTFLGISYYQRYHRFSLYCCITFSYVGFVLYLMIKLLTEFTPMTVPNERSQHDGWPKLQWPALAALACIFTLLKNAPWHHVIYYLTPLFVLQRILASLSTFQLVPMVKIQLSRTMLFMALCLLLVEILVLSFFERRFLSLAILIVVLRQVFRSPLRHGLLLKSIWCVLCLLLCLFTFQPSVGEDHDPLLVAASGLVSGVAAYTFFVYFLPVDERRQRNVSSTPLLIAIAYIGISSTCALIASYSPAGSTLRHFGQIGGWLVVLTSVTVAMLTESWLLPRLLALTTSFQATYLLLSLSYEGFFLLILVAVLFTWLIMEHQDSFAFQNWHWLPLKEKRERRILTLDDVWRALLFLLFSVVSFFGTGNLASINSFDPRSIRTLVSVFNPFLMGGLLFIKVLLPFIIVSCFVCCIRIVTQMPSRGMFMLLLLFSDLMALHFFFLVTDRGSWLEIGTSLSHFVIAELTVIFLQLLYLLAKYLLQTDCLLGRRRSGFTQASTTGSLAQKSTKI